MRAVQAVRRGDRVDEAVPGPNLDAELASSPLMCMSILREPMLQPPGIATRAWPRRATSGPRTAIDARICATIS